jgi:HPt (histidine-containing phosphotransfer) domain-containing protein
VTDIDEIEREIRELSREYVRELPQRFQALIEQVAQLKNGIGEPGAAKSEAHKIKGTASSYGVHDVGAQAVIIDDCLKQLSKSADAATPELWARLDLALTEALRLSNEAVERVNAEP